MSSSPLPIRRAGPGDTLSRSAKEQLVVTPSGHLYGSTPGGTRIVYSREQLLSLASSPLSKTPPHIPAEISRSPDKNGHVLISSYRSNGASHGATGAGWGSMDKAGYASAGQVFGQNGNAAAFARSPPKSARSPGNAFNFGNGSLSLAGVNSSSSSLKERLAQQQHHNKQHHHQQQQQQQQQQHPIHPSLPAKPQSHAESDGSPPSSSNGGAIAERQETSGSAHGEEQFSMDL